MATSWEQKFRNAPSPKVVVLERPFAGLTAVARLFIASPDLIERAIRAVPPGRTLEVRTLRQHLAAEHGADATCPLTTAIFLRIVAERAIEQRARGVPREQVAPFWRVIAPDTPLAAKLPGGPAMIERERAIDRAAA